MRITSFSYSKCLLISVLFLLVFNCFTQAPTISWQKTLGGSSYDWNNDILATQDGGYITVGQTDSNNGDVSGSHGESDCWVVKLDGAGTVSWKVALGGSNFDGGYNIQQSPDGGYIIASFSFSINGQVTGHHGTTNAADAWIVKLDAVGNLLWQKSFGGSNNEVTAYITTTNDGYVFVCSTNSIDGDLSTHYGTTNTSDLWVVKLDTAGNIVWQKVFGGTKDDGAYAVKQTADGGYIVLAYSMSSDGDLILNKGNLDAWVIKLDAVGNVIWQSVLGGANVDALVSIQATSDMGYILAGFSKSSDGDLTYNQGDFDCWVVKIDSVGNLIWQKSFGGSGDDRIYDVQVTPNGSYITFGYNTSNNGDVSINYGLDDCWLVKLDTIGNLIWEKSFGGSNYDEGNSMQFTADGGFILSGVSASNDGDVLGGHGQIDFWVIKTNSTTNLESLDFESFRLFPNPTQGDITATWENLSSSMPLTIRLLNSIGQAVFTQTVEKSSAFQYDLSEQTPGIYFLYFSQGTKILVKKVHKL